MYARDRGVTGLVILLTAVTGPVLSDDLRTLDARALSSAFVAAIAKVAPAVVSIHGQREIDPGDVPLIRALPKRYRDLFYRHPPMQKWQGSGIIIREDGLVLTNHHVLEGAEEVTIGLADGRQFPGELVGSDPHSDIALLQIKEPPGDLPTASLGDSDRVRIGEWVLAIGSPFGLAGSVSEGIISAKHRTRDQVPVGEESHFFYKDFLQTTAAINVGNSGGPLINLDGEVIGINNSIQTAGVQANLGIGFAVPSNMTRFVVESLLKYGHVVRGWLGVEVETLREQNAEKWGTLRGVRVINVHRNTPAEKAGVEQGDVIVAFNETEIYSRPQLQNLVSQTAVGSSATLSVMRDKRELTLSVIIEELPRQLLAGTEEREKAFFGFSAEELTKRNREQYGYPPGSNGMVITEVVEGSNAEKAGLKKGDLIIEIEEPVTDFDTYEQKMEDLLRRVALKKEMIILLYVDRSNVEGDFPRYFPLKIRPIEISPRDR